MSSKSSKFSNKLLNPLMLSILVGVTGCGGGGSSGTPVPVPEPFDSGLLADGGFELGSDAWIGNAVNFESEEGNEDNTVNFADVATAGNPFDVNLSQIVSITQGQRYTLNFKARTSAENTRTMLAGIGLNEDPFTNTSQEITLTSEFQDFSLTLDATNFGIENSRILFDMGADTGVVILDNVNLVEVGPIPAPPFDGGLLSNGDFEDGATGWIGNAASVSDELLGVDGTQANFANVATAGNPFDVNLSQIVEITQGNSYTLSFQAKSDGGRSIIAGIGLNEGDFANTAEPVNLTEEFQTFTLTQTATFGSENSRVLFDMGAETGVVIIDEVSLIDNGPAVVAPPAEGELLSNGDFESGAASWIGNAANVTDELLGANASRANFANIAAAGNPFDVNLSQVVAITQGTTYTLVFTAKSDGNRTMIAGIGLNEGDFANTAEVVNLTPDFQTFSLTQAATFGSDNSRVLFDMGADTGVVIIDDVSLMVAE